MIKIDALIYLRNKEDIDEFLSSTKNHFIKILGFAIRKSKYSLDSEEMFPFEKLYEQLKQKGFISVEGYEVIFRKKFSGKHPEELINLINNLDSPMQENEEPHSQNQCCIIAAITKIIYDNPLLNQPELVKEALKTNRIDDLIKLGEGEEMANVIIEALGQYNAEHVLNIFLGEEEVSEEVAMDFSQYIINNAAKFIEETGEQLYSLLMLQDFIMIFAQESNKYAIFSSRYPDFDPEFDYGGSYGGGYEGYDMTDNGIPIQLFVGNATTLVEYSS